MENKTNIILAAPKEFIEPAARTGLPVALMTYKIGRGYHLYRAQGAPRYAGGLMVLDTSGYTGGGPLSGLVEEIYAECRAGGFSGVVLNPADRIGLGQAALASRLANLRETTGLTVYVPESMADMVPGAVVLVQTALSGGSLARHLREAVARYGAENIALEIERVRMDFTLPAKTGTGRELMQEELEALLDTYKPKIHYSEELVASYFIYRSRKRTHFVLFDNAATIRRKLTHAARAGIDTAFLFYPNVYDILDEIMR
ncbi:MAG TPA: hypothetical protein GXZ77_02605 [Papillibacter sp.]|nr:hypothetical protein [Papillibacter sp.]